MTIILYVKMAIIMTIMIKIINKIKDLKCVFDFKTIYLTFFTNLKRNI